MTLLSLLNDHELKTLTGFAAMYGVESDQYMNYWDTLAEKYHNVILVHFARLRAIEGGKKDEKRD